MKYAIRTRAKPGGEPVYGETYCGVDAETLGTELQRLSDKHGRLKPPEIVKAARRDNSPLHPCFTWNVKEAAEKCWIEEARKLVQVIVLVDEEKESRPPVRAFVSLLEQEPGSEDPEPAYVHMLDAMGDPERRAQVLERAMRELEAWRKRYENLVELADVFAVIDRSIERRAEN